MNKVKPTDKQKAALKGIMEGKKKGKAMIDAGYSELSARSPNQNLLETSGFQELIKDLDDYSKETYKLDSAKKANRAVIDALEANKIHGTGDDFIEIPDHKIRLEAADRVHELHGFKKKETFTPIVPIQVVIKRYGDESDRDSTPAETRGSVLQKS